MVATGPGAAATPATAAITATAAAAQRTRRKTAITAFAGLLAFAAVAPLSTAVPPRLRHTGRSDAQSPPNSGQKTSAETVKDAVPVLAVAVTEIWTLTFSFRLTTVRLEPTPW